MTKLKDIKPVKGTLHKLPSDTGINVSVHLGGNKLPEAVPDESVKAKPLRNRIAIPVQLMIAEKKYESMLIFDAAFTPHLSLCIEATSPDGVKIQKALKHFDIARTITLRMRVKLRKAKAKNKKKKLTE